MDEAKAVQMVDWKAEKTAGSWAALTAACWAASSADPKVDEWEVTKAEKTAGSLASS